MTRTKKYTNFDYNNTITDNKQGKPTLFVFGEITASND